MSFLTWLLRSHFETSTIGKTAHFPQKLLQCLNSSVLIKLFPTSNPNLCCCTLNLFILSIWLAQKIKSLCASSMEIQKGNLSEWRKASSSDLYWIYFTGFSNNPVLLKCLLGGLQAFDTHTEPLQHPPSFTWIEFQPCETGCGIKTKARSYDWEMQVDLKYIKIVRW